MEPHQPSRSAPIEKLPNEILCMILSALPNIQSLRNAILSSPRFYYGSLGAQTGIIADILSRQIDPSVLPEAVLAWRSSQWMLQATGCKKGEAALGFAHQYLLQRASLVEPLTLAQALHLDKLHFYVRIFTQKFLAAALACTSNTKPVTHQETCRTERAFYRFEIYCNLAREFSEGDDQNEPFFANFAPWENEQLGCIHDFLFRSVTPSLIENSLRHMMDDDDREGTISFFEDVECPTTQSVLSHGLEHVHQIITATSDKEREALIGREPYSKQYPLGSHNPYCNFWFLHHGLRYCSYQHYLNKLAGVDELLFFPSPFFPDPDPGPRRAWQMEHWEECLDTSVFRPDREDIRASGYVMWDQSRVVPRQ